MIHNQSYYSLPVHKPKNGKIYEELKNVPQYEVSRGNSKPAEARSADIYKVIEIIFWWI